MFASSQRQRQEGLPALNWGGQAGVMPSIDLPLEELRTYMPEETEPADFDQFWAKTLEEARSAGPGLQLDAPYMPLAGVEAHHVWMTGFGSARLSGWYVRPATGGPFPGIAHFHGYSGRGARPLETYALAAQGIAVLSMDCRGQGGDSPDVPPLGGGHYPGWLTSGLADPATYYYRYVFADAVLAVDALAAQDEVDETRIAITGASQGGGLSLAAAALSGRASFVWADVPFLSDFPRAVTVAPNPPYTELAEFLRRRPELADTAFQTLSYVDVANHARRVTCPTRVTVGLCDDICPPSTVFAAYGRLACEDKELLVFPYHGHGLTYEIEERRHAELVRALGAGNPRL
jgi:cephalosporin-C deacetylase